MRNEIEKYFRSFGELIEKERYRVSYQIKIDNDGVVREEQVTSLAEEAPEFAYIGKIVTEWSYLEAMIDMTIWHLSSSEANLTACITAQLVGPSNRMFALIALCGEIKVSPKLIKELNKFKSHLGAVGEQRNRVAHDPWEKIGTLTVKKTLTAKGELVMVRRSYSTESLSDLLEKIRKLSAVFSILFRSIQSERGI